MHRYGANDSTSQLSLNGDEFQVNIHMDRRYDTPELQGDPRRHELDYFGGRVPVSEPRSSPYGYVPHLPSVERRRSRDFSADRDGAPRASVARTSNEASQRRRTEYQAQPQRPLSAWSS